MNNEVQLTNEKETLFITLCAKALDYRSKHSILEDKTADDLVRKVKLDISKYKGFGNDVMVIRAKQFDEWIKQFIAINQNAVVLYLGCGLDTRITRIKPPSYVSWFDVDYPEVISLRKNFFSDKNEYRMIASSVTEQGWLSQIPANMPTLIIAEGLLEYLTPEEVKILLNRLTNYFAHGQVIFDVMNSFAIQSGKESLKRTTGAVHKWAVDDVTEVDRMNLKWKRLKYLPLFKSPFVKQLPYKRRFLLGLASFIPKFKNMIGLMQYQF
jgi:O-methyltransferase involved in polyketide biosynthesis